MILELPWFVLFFSNPFPPGQSLGGRSMIHSAAGMLCMAVFTPQTDFPVAVCPLLSTYSHQADGTKSH